MSSRICTCTVIFALVGSIALAEEIALRPSKDNTLIEDAPTLSNGMGNFFYAGRVGPNGGQTVRRGCIAFDLTEIPTNATIESVTLDLNLFSVGAGTSDGVVSLHRLLSDWGEGESDSFGGDGDSAEPGDATWDHTFFPDQFWSTPGGDFTDTVSASQVCPNSGEYTWGPTDQMTADVQAWVADPSTNFGWLVRGDESGIRTARAFASRNINVQEVAPELFITYSVNIVPGDCDNDGDVDIQDFNENLACVTGPDMTSTNPDCTCVDLDDDGDIDFADFATFQRAFTGD